MNITVILISMSVFCLFLSITRIAFTGTGEYLFLNWNLFLAFIPWILSMIIASRKKHQDNILTLFLLIFTWLIFFPNSPYILTDLFHLQNRRNAPQWFDLIIILSFAWTGLSYGFHSLLNIESLLTERLKPRIINFFMVILLFMGSFGVYLGRFLRWNSWDIINNPVLLLSDVFERIYDPLSHPRTWGMTILLGILLNMIFWSVKMFTVRKYNFTGVDKA
ncbi:MAG: DUF1361 domain-containing protein [Ignavibacteria bacterium]